MKNKILITGATGFVGKSLLPYLQETYEVATINRVQLQYIAPQYFDGVDTIVHLAGKAHDLKKNVDPESYIQINYKITKELFDAFLASDAKKFIFISSVKAVADSVVGILTEAQIPDPKTAYGRSKLMAEKYIQSALLPPEKSFYILRPCMIHGIGNKGNLNLLYKFVKKGIPYPLAAFENKRSFLSVTNLCFVIKELITQESPSGTYNIADNEALSTNEVVAILADSLNQKSKFWYIPANLISILACIGDKLRLPLNTERLKKLTESYVVSNQKIKQTIQKDLPISAHKGLEITASAFK